MSQATPQRPPPRALTHPHLGLPFGSLWLLHVSSRFFSFLTYAFLARLGSNRQTLQKKFFLSFPNFSRCQEGARETLQLQSEEEEGTCSKTFPSPPSW